MRGLSLDDDELDGEEDLLPALAVSWLAGLEPALASAFALSSSSSYHGGRVTCGDVSGRDASGRGFELPDDGCSGTLAGLPPGLTLGF